MLITSSLFLIAGAAQAYAATTTSSNLAPQFSPVFANMKKATGVVTSYNPSQFPQTTTLDTSGLKGYPNAWESPSTTSAEVKAAYNAIDWSKVPKAPVRKQKSDGSWVSDSDGDADPYCWWSSTNCVSPKASYLPKDVYNCPSKGDWGLNYDDGPFNRYTDENAKKENPYAEPALYNFLYKTNQKATLFYIGSNVATYPAAAKRGLNDGHQLCVHTWSHPVMTTQTNAQVVAELYWTLKAIKEATGVTSRCWRPPQGDVDDRVRSIAWQMGLRTILWDEDTNDWDMPAPGGGNLSPKKVDAFFANLIKNEKANKYDTGHIVLEHELNSATVNMSMFWMPKLQSTFNVVPALTCNNILQPYWEENFVYPKDNSAPAVPTVPTKTTTSGTIPTGLPSTCIAGSFGLGKGDGYNGACCKDQADCLDDCLSGSCNGLANPSKTTTTTTKKAAATTTKKAATTTTKKAATTTTKKATTSTKKPTASPSCIAGARGKKKGNGKTGYCCSSSDDCLETCRSGTCGL